MFAFDINQIEEARQIVKDLQFPEEFGSIDDVNIDSMLNTEDDYTIDSGVSKLVINIDKFPFVIKIPFRGQWLEMDSDYDDEDTELNFCPFYGAMPYGQCDNYCADELQKTRAVQEAGFGEFVPEMMYLCTVDGLDIFIQEKVKEQFCSRNSIHPTEDSLKRAVRMRSSFESEWLALVIDCYGEDEWDAFSEWVKSEEPEIFSDCHTGNYGIRMDGTPVIFDISGFRD